MSEQEEARVLELLEFKKTKPTRFLFPQIGETVADFELMREIGRGGAGIVYLARQISLQRKVALKLIPFEPVQETSQQLQRHEREGRILASLCHEAVVTVHTAGVAAGFRYVAMDYIEGCTLRERIEDRQEEDPCLGGPEWLPYILKQLHRMSGALAAAHQHGIIHRDVKPENVLLDSHGAAFLADFGLAREHEPTGMTITRGFVGTPRYASPEQMRGETLAATSDVFSFGALAFEALTGQQAFPAKEARRVQEQIHFHDPSWPTRLIPRDVRAVVEKCLEKRPRDRYPSAQQVEREFARLLRFEPVEAIPRNRVSKVVRRALRRPGQLLWIGALILLSGSASMAFLLAGSQSASLQRLELERSFDEAHKWLLLGKYDRYEKSLLKLMREEPQALPQAAALLGDLKLWTMKASAAHRYYRLALRGGNDSLALLGSSLASHKVQGHFPPDEIVVRHEPPATAREWSLRAIFHLHRNEDREALTALTHATELEPACFLWRRERARVLHRIREFKVALRDYRILNNLHPEDLELALDLSRVLGAAGRFDEQEDFMRKYLTWNPKNEFFLAELAFSLRGQMRIQEAIQYAEESMALNPESAWVLSVLCSIYIADNRHQDALRKVEAFAAENPESEELQLAFAQVHYEMGNLSEASRYAQEFVGHRFPYWRVQGLRILALVERKRNELDTAEDHYRQLMLLDPDCWEWPAYLGQVLLKQGEFDEAGAFLDQALTMNGANSVVLRSKGWLERRAGRLRDALFIFEQALGVDPDDGQNHYWLARTWYDLGEPRAALQYMPRVLEQFPNNWMDAWILQALCHYRLENYDAAVEAYENSLKVTNHPQVRADMAEALDLAGRDQESLKEYQKAREQNPQLPSAWCGEGLLRLNSPDPEVRNIDQAVQLLARASELAPENIEYRRYLSEAQAAANMRFKADFSRSDY